MFSDKKQMAAIHKQMTEKQQLYMNVFCTPEGESVLEDLASRCFEKVTTYDDNPGRMAFNEGRRSVYKHIIGIINRDIKDIVEELSK